MASTHSRSGKHGSHADAHAPLPAQPSVDALRAAFSLQEGATFALQEDELGPVANAAAAVRAEKKRLKKERKRSAAYKEKCLQAHNREKRLTSTLKATTRTQAEDLVA